MKKIKINNELFSICPNIKLGCIQYSVNIEKKNKELWKKIDIEIERIKNDIKIEEIKNEKDIKYSRELYKKIGKDPNRYRISSEALLRRIAQGKGLYNVNNIVDLNNLISIISKYSVGSYDINKIGNDLEFRIGKNGEKYKGIGKDIINIENLPVFVDEDGPYGSPTSDSERAMITNDSKSILTVLISFSDDSDIEKYIKEFVDLLNKYTNASGIETYIT